MRIIVYFLLFGLPLPLFSQGVINQFFSLQQDFHDYGVSVLDGKVVNFDSTFTQSTRIGFNQRLGNKSLIAFGISNGQMWVSNLENQFAYKNNSLGLDATLILKTKAMRIGHKNPILSPNFSFGYHYLYFPKQKKTDYLPKTYSLRYAIGLELAIKKHTSVVICSALNQQLSGSFETHLVHSLGIIHGIRFSDKEKPKEVKKRANKLENNKTVDSLFYRSIEMIKDASIEKNASNRAKIDSLEGAIRFLNENYSRIKKEIFQLSNLANRKEIAQMDNMNPTSNADKSKNLDTANTNSEIFVEIVKEKTQSFYVVILSARDIQLAIKEAKRISQNYPSVRILADQSGFYRTAIFAGTDKKIAKVILDGLVAQGITQAWIAYY